MTKGVIRSKREKTMFTTIQRQLEENIMRRELSLVAGSIFVSSQPVKSDWNDITDRADP